MHQQNEISILFVNIEILITPNVEVSYMNYTRCHFTWLKNTIRYFLKQLSSKALLVFLYPFCMTKNYEVLMK